MTNIGELAALATAVCWTVTALSFESAGRRIGSLAVNVIRLAMGAVLLALATWIWRGHALPTDATTHAWLWLGLSGLVGFTIGDLCLFRAFVLIGARLSMLVMTLVPPMTAAIGLALMGEVLNPRQLAGMVLTVAGVVWVVLERSPHSGAQPQKPRTGGLVLAIGGAAGQSLGLVLAKIGMGDYDAIAATHIRVLTGLAGFLVLYTAMSWWPRVVAAVSDRPAMARTTLGAIFGPFLGVSLSLVAVQRTATGVAATLMAIVPVLIIAPSVLLFGEKVSARAVLGAVVAVAGSALMFL